MPAESSRVFRRRLVPCLASFVLRPPDRVKQEADTPSIAPSREASPELPGLIQHPYLPRPPQTRAASFKRGDGYPEDAGETRGVVVWRRVAPGTGSPLLPAAQRGSRRGQVRLILRNCLRRVLSQQTRTSIPASGPILPRHDDRVLRGTR